MIQGMLCRAFARPVAVLRWNENGEAFTPKHFGAERFIASGLSKNGRFSVPEGLTDCSLAIHCQGICQRFRPVGNGVICFEA